MKRNLSIALIISTLAIQQASADFSGYFAPTNWTFTNTNADGALNTGGAPGNIIFSGGNNGSETSGSTTYTIVAPTAGVVSFNWAYQTFDGDGPQWDPFGYIQSGDGVELSNGGGLDNQSGFASFPINAGQLMGFFVNTDDNGFGPAEATISNFEFTPSGAEIPFGVDSTTGLALLGLASAWKFRRRRKA